MNNKICYTRSSKLSTKFLNNEKKKELTQILDEYKNLVQKFVEYFWVSENRFNLPKFCDAKTYNLFNSFLGAYLKQAAGKQALGIVKGTLEKQKRRLFIYEKLNSEGKFKQARKLKKIIDKVNLSCPEIENIEIELGGCPSIVRFENSENTKVFDTWLYVSLSQTKLNKTHLPLKKTRHFNKLLHKGGKLSTGCRISKDFITFTFKFEKEIKQVENPRILGIDVGIVNVISCSDGFQSKPGLSEIQQKLARRKKGSKRFQRTQQERLNFINWSINQLNLQNVDLVKREDIKDIRRYHKSSRFMTAWKYPEIFDKLERYCEEQDVLVVKISPTYTSQRCSVCGYVLKTNRKGKIFKCAGCGYTGDADLNASQNISFNLRGIGKQERLKHKNKIGFYWHVSS